jgi:hypothetical protein
MGRGGIFIGNSLSLIRAQSAIRLEAKLAPGHELPPDRRHFEDALTACGLRGGDCGDNGSGGHGPSIVRHIRVREAIAPRRRRRRNGGPCRPPSRPTTHTATFTSVPRT